jgi:hypothetical protein
MCLDDPSLVCDSLMPKERIQELTLYGKQLEEAWYSEIFSAASRNNFLNAIRLEHHKLRMYRGVLFALVQAIIMT